MDKSARITTDFINVPEESLYVADIDGGNYHILVRDSDYDTAIDKATKWCLNRGYVPKHIGLNILDSDEIAGEGKIMVFDEKEQDQIRYALDYLHDADLSDFGADNIKALESSMDKLGMKYDSQL